VPIIRPAKSRKLGFLRRNKKNNSMNDPDYDGLCGIPLNAALRGGLKIRCNLPMGHHGDHSWKKYERHFYISSYCGRHKPEKPIQRILRKMKEEQEEDYWKKKGYGRTSQLTMAPGSNPDEV